MLGQINRGTKLGELIYKICSQTDVLNIVDIGTWNGMGTTKCIYDAIVDNNKKNYNVISLESNEEMHKQALYNLPKLENFNLVLGRIIEIEELLNEDSLGQEYFKKIGRHHLEKWLKEDIINYSKIPNVINIMPEEIDVLILDGGEFSSFSEFKKLEHRSKYFILDDTNLMKNFEVSELIRNNNNYSILFDEPNDRNGFLIAKKNN
jgi:hypothetical protein